MSSVNGAQKTELSEAVRREAERPGQRFLERPTGLPALVLCLADTPQASRAEPATSFKVDIRMFGNFDFTNSTSEKGYE